VGWKDVLCDRSVEERSKGTRLASFTPRRLSRRTYLPWCCGSRLEKQQNTLSTFLAVVLESTWREVLELFMAPVVAGIR
jgi:hypothetical protein